MPKIEKFLPFAAVLYLLRGLYYLWIDLVGGSSYLLIIISSLYTRSLQNITSHISVLSYYIFVLLLLLGLIKHLIDKEKKIDKLMMIGLAFFSFRFLLYLPIFILRILQVSPLGSLSVVDYIFMIPALIGMLIVFIFFNKRRDSFQRSPFPSTSRKYEIPAYTKYLKEKKNTIALKRFFNYPFDLLIVLAWAEGAFYFFNELSSGLLSFNLFFYIYRFHRSHLWTNPWEIHYRHLCSI